MVFFFEFIMRWLQKLRNFGTIKVTNKWCTPKLSLRFKCESKGETMEKGMGIQSLVCSILRVKGRTRAPKWELGWVISKSIIHMNLHKSTSWLMHSWSTFDARMNHKHTRTHKTHHGSDLWEAITFPLIILFVINNIEATSKCHFISGLPQL